MRLPTKCLPKFVLCLNLYSEGNPSFLYVMKALKLCIVVEHLQVFCWVICCRATGSILCVRLRTPKLWQSQNILSWMGVPQG